MITIRTMVPMPINMGFLSDARRPLRDGALCTWLASAGRVGGLSRAALGAAAGGGRVRYFLKTSLIFSPACLRWPLA
jgi:hypothetical protein